jgi:hypothetical protein
MVHPTDGNVDERSSPWNPQSAGTNQDLGETTMAKKRCKFGKLKNPTKRRKCRKKPRR